MIGRRNFVLSASGALLGAVIGTEPSRAQVTTADQSVTTPVSEQLLHTTVRIEWPVPGGMGSGTGFFFGFFNDGKTEITALVSNKHVLASGSPTCNIVFTGKGKDGKPDLNKHVPVTINDLQSSLILHPDPAVDLAILPISGVLNELDRRGTPVYFVSCRDNTIPDSSARASLTPLEDILTVGFPGQVWDAVHNLPIFHRGITATPPNVDFQGKREFLIDSAVWAGASGSPVFLFETGALIDYKSNATSFGWKLMLLGIVYANVRQDVSGNIFVQQIPTQPHVESFVPSNLGICISSTRILDFQSLLIAKGAQPPKGFKMRTSTD